MKRKSNDKKLKELQKTSNNEASKYMDHLLDDESRTANTLTDDEKFEQERDKQHKIRREKVNSSQDKDRHDHIRHKSAKDTSNATQKNKLK